MNLITKLAIGLVIGLIAAFTTVYLDTGNTPGLFLISAFVLACGSSVLLTSLPASADVSVGGDQPSENNSDGYREEGLVKWFNASKGFGFITKDDGEEIFVHFRSIRGEGRRSLQDGQRVSFEVVNSEKGPQAEDVAEI